MTDVYLHIGLAKTGTTSIQMALQESTAALAEHGVEFAGGKHAQQRLAVFDFLGRRIEGSEAHEVSGSWQRLLKTIDESTARAVVVSEELLAVTRPRQARRLARALEGHRVFVVVGVRDLGRHLPSSWQEEIVKGHSFTWGEFLAAARDPALGAATAGVAFQLRSDLLRILDTWEEVAPRERIRLITVPPSGSAPGLLLDRFAEVIGVPSGVLRGERPRHNEALGPAEVEVLRRLNATLRPELTQAQQVAVAKKALRLGLAGRATRRLTLPDSERDWVTERTQTLVAELKNRGYEVHGDLAELDPQLALPGDRAPDDVTEAELLDATEAGLQSVSLAYTSLWKRHQSLKGRREGEASVGTRLTSSARAASFGARVSVLERADRNRFLGWLLRSYVGRSSHT